MSGLPKVGELLQQEVSRKEFLRYAGVAVLSLVGITSMINNIRSVGTQSDQRKSTSGYGMSAYGR